MEEVDVSKLFDDEVDSIGLLEDEVCVAMLEVIGPEVVGLLEDEVDEIELLDNDDEAIEMLSATEEDETKFCV